MSQVQAPDPRQRSGASANLQFPPSTASTTGQASARSAATERSSTPRLLRRVRAVAVGLLVATSVIGALSAAATDRATEAVRDNTGPVLVATQNLRSSLAEADAAAVAAFLTAPNEDPRQRRAYLDALQRANEQIEDVAALIGDDPVAHEVLKDLSADVTRYASLVEAARATRLIGAEGSQSYLLEAVTLLDTEIAGSADALLAQTQTRLDADTAEQSGFATVALVVGLAALAALLYAQAMLLQRTRRILNVGALAATILTIAAIVWLSTATEAAVVTARQAAVFGYDAIVQTSEVQSLVFESKAAATEAVITEDRSQVERALAALDQLFDRVVAENDVVMVRNGTVVGSGELANLARTADSPRESAAAAELLARFSAYQRSLQSTLGVPAEQAAARLAGPVATDFNAVNFTLEGVLAANRDQFLQGLADADRRLAGLVWIALVLPLLAAAALWGGVQARLNDYR